ncbi:enoyl-CoA hydratase [Natronocella acetinitrilica]|uniref:Enoyl-CoA hydratase n=1 Tax=Natronocella acetinitrilica TaxID=414046 RepID=A0AAE3G6L3_9GAMM|nr:enoyl-CoA hydratase/isomerase family protein [Natronocella acetinitrilica]MCP1675701.1 enoyl-CoA hydratase [Natronocella acetinitrilica]
MTFEQLLVEQNGELLRVTINRPGKRNALSRGLLDELRTVFTVYANRTDIKLAVLSGAGDKCFSAGGDLYDLANVRSAEQTKAMSHGARDALSAVRDFPTPVIAALNGDALGGGAELALSCDFIVARQDIRIGFIQGRMNIGTAWGGGIRLMERLGPTMALRLLARSELVAATEAKAIGLIDVMAENEDSLQDTVDAFVAPMLNQVPQVMRAFKALRLGYGRTLSLPELEKLETDHLVSTWTHDDHWAAVSKVLTGIETKR